MRAERRKMKHKLLGKMVKIKSWNKKYPDPYEGEQGKVVCIVRERRFRYFIVQFENEWSFFRSRSLVKNV